MTIASALLTIVLFLQPAMPQPPKLTARLLAAHESVQPGGQTELLVEIQVDKPWHVYHPIVLDTGLATDVEFATPLGVTIGELRYPAPVLGKTASLEYLELSGKIHAIAPLRLAADVEPGRTMPITARITGLACIERCVPVKTAATLELPVTAEQGRPANAEFFQEARKKLAPALPDAPYLKGSELRISKGRLGIDEPAELRAVIRVQNAHHIQDRDPGVDTLIASRLFIEKVAGLEFAKEGKQVWPTPHVRDFPGFGKVREQSGEVTIRVPFRITDQEYRSGPVTVRVLLSYQACTDAGTCYPPEMAEGFVHFVADTPNPPRAASVAAQDMVTSVARAAGEEPVERAAPSEPSESELEVVVPRLTAEDWAEHIPWQPWRPGRPEELSRLGHTVYVDFTATWCITCLANKRLVLETEAVRSKMGELGVIPLKADFTNRDPVMHQEIRNWAPTVPVNLVYAPGKPEVVALLPAVLTKGVVIRALESPEEFAAEGGKRRNLLLVLLGGFLGGLILNVMPCVLPVISIKILSFVQQSGEDPKRVFRLGLAFCAGIMVWFWAFAALSATGDLPWQYPQVVIALGAVLFVFSLNLFGVFELVLPGAAVGQLGALAGREGYSGAFLKGLLATLLGTACTAPFLAGAMAYALTQPAWIVFLVFSAAGVGMGFPYLLLSAKPAWLKFIPKPGPWMVRFKQAAGFVLLGTVVWLLWVLADQLDGKGVVWTVAFFGFLGLGAWMLGMIRPTWQTSGRATMWTASVAVAVLGFFFCYFWMYDWNAGKAGGPASQAAATRIFPVASSQSGPAPEKPVLVRKGD